MLKLSVFLLASSVACTALGQDRPLRDAAIGSWKGRVAQPGAAPYSVEMNVGKDATGRLVATTNYPELGCRGVLSLVAESVIDLRFLERIDPPTPRCVNAGYVLLRAENGELAWGWATPAGALAASARLARVGAAAALAAAASPPATLAAGGRPGAVAERPADPADLPAMGKAIDRAFLQWSTRWMWDRYIPESAVVAESRSQNGVHLIRGTFRFSRGGGMATIPFASTLQKQGASWLVSSLCYNDTTSGMTDCASNAISAGARNFLGLVIVGGLLAAISGYEGDADTDRDGSAAADDARREREQRAEQRRARQRDEEENQRYWSRQFEPSPLLPPPATLN